MQQYQKIKAQSQTNSAAANSNSTVIQNKAVELQDNRPASILQKKANNTGLPDNLKSGIENLSGHSMDDIKVHYNSDKPAKLNAHAYAQGTNIHLASGQEKHLPHEAWHVVQQKQGRVKPTLQMKGKVNVNDDKALENEADVMGKKATANDQLVLNPNKKLLNKHFSSSTFQKVKKKETPKEKFERQMKELNEHIAKANDKIANIHKIKAELGTDSATTPMNPAVHLTGLGTTDTLHMTKHEARLANFSSMIKELVNSKQKNNVTPEVQIALVKSTLDASESIYVSGNTANSNKKTGINSKSVLGDYYRQNIRSISVNRRVKGIEDLAKSVSYKSKGKLVVKGTFKNSIAAKKGESKIDLKKRIVRKLFDENKHNAQRVSGTSARKFARAHVKKRMRVPANKDNIHAESAILASIRDTKNKIQEIGGTKVACMACQAYFTKLGEQALLGDYTGYGWISKSSQKQLQTLMNSIKSAEDYLVNLVTILESRLKSLKRFTGAAGDKDISQAEMESDVDDTDSEDEDSFVILQNSALIGQIADILLNVK